MGRPSAKVLMACFKRNYIALEVLDGAGGVWVVTYGGEPISLRARSTLKDGATKYKRTAFVNSGHAFRLARELNKTFSTNAFEVYYMTDGNVVTR